MSFLKKIFKGEKKNVAIKSAKEKDIGGTENTGVFESRAKTTGVIAGVLNAAHITEKTANSGTNKYAFLVNRKANKAEIKRAIGSRYGVDVLSVNIVNLPAKERRRGRQIGWKPGRKKATVKIKEGQSIEVQ